MWRVSKLHLKNFMSYEDEVFVFPQQEATIIQGVNLTDEGFENNGSGKSASLEGLSVGVLNTTLRRETTPKDLVRRGETDCNILTELVNSVTKEVLLIDRKVFSNTKSVTVDIFLNEKKVENLVSVRDADTWIIDKIGVSKQDLFNYFLISSEKFESFFSISDRNKKDLIGRFSNSNIVDIVIENLKKRKESFETQLTKITQSIIGSTSTISSYEELIKEKKEATPETKESFSSKVTQKLEECKSSIQKLKTNLSTYTTSKEENELKVKDFEKEIKQIESRKDEVEGKISDIKKDSSKIVKQKSDTEKVLQQLELKLLNKVECPSCKFVFNPNNSKEVDIKDIQNSISIAKNYITKLDSSIEKYSKQVQSYNTKVTTLEQELSLKKREKKTVSDTVSSLTSSISSTNIQISSQENLIKELQKSVNSFQEVDVESVVRDLRTKCEEEKKKKEKSEEDKKKLEDKIEKNSYWITTFTRFKTHLSNKVIKVIECFINEYLSRMNTDIRVVIDGYKMNKDNSVTEKISVSLHREDGDSNSFATYSNGERARVEIAGIFAIQKLINTSIRESGSTGGLEFTFLDEIIDSVDSKGMFNIMKTLQSLEKTINVISHVLFKEHSEDQFNTITVVKKNKITNIKDIKEVVEIQ